MKKKLCLRIIFAISSFFLFFVILAILGILVVNENKGFIQLLLIGVNVLGTQNLPENSILNSLMFLDGMFLGFVFFIFAEPKRQITDNYIEKKINRIFDKNFSEKIKSSCERLRNIENEFLDYENDSYINIAIEISNKNQDLYSQFPILAIGLIGIFAAFIQIPLINQKFSSGFLIGVSFLILFLIYEETDNSKKWKIMYYDLMQVRSNRERC